MTLYEINKEIYSLVDEETGEIKDLEALESLTLDRETKIENIALWIKDLLADAEKIKAEKANLEAREKICRNRAERLKNLLDMTLQGNSFSTAKTNISYRKSMKCVITNEEEFKKTHPEYVKSVTSEKISLNDVKQALKDGQTISGAELQECSNIQIK